MSSLLALSWSDLVGWFLIALGIAMIIFGLVMVSRAPDFGPAEAAWGVVVAGAAVVVLGWTVIQEGGVVPDCDNDPTTWDPFC